MKRSWVQTYGFGFETWEQIKTRLSGFGATHVVEIVESIERELPAGTLIGSSLMGGGLAVRPLPVPDDPYDVVVVHTPNTLGGTTDGKVAIEHRSVTGRNDRIERPIADSIPLFWRFMIEKFGIHPRRDEATPPTR